MPQNSGPSRAPTTKLNKKLQYTEQITLNNSTSTYSYYSRYIKPDITRCEGALAQFAAHELWRIKKIKVSIQLAGDAAGTAFNNINVVPTAVIWTAADLGSNESISGETIMQYQNAKRNTINVNKWTNIVDTTCNINASLDTSGSYNYILPRSTWLNTSYFNSSSYSGYQLFIQNYGSQQNTVVNQPSFTVQTELIVEFLQPAFQTSTTSFTAEAFNMRMTVQESANDPSVLRTYIFDRLLVGTDAVTNERVMSIRLTREDGVAGSLTFSNLELRSAIETGTSGSYFGGRPIIYDGPMPPREIPAIDFEVNNM